MDFSTVNTTACDVEALLLRRHELLAQVAGIAGPRLGAGIWSGDEKMDVTMIYPKCSMVLVYLPT